MSILYVTREAWGAGPLRSGSPVGRGSFVGLAVHHTVMARNFANGSVTGVKSYMRQLQHSRPDLGDEVPYSFVVFPGATDADAIVAEGRGAGWSGAHTVDYNSTRYGVCYAGNASTERITPGIIAGINWVGKTQIIVPHPARTFGHRDVKATECPGNNLYPRLTECQPPYEVGDEDLPLNLEDLNKIRDIVQNNKDKVVVEVERIVARHLDEVEDVVRNNSKKDRRVLLDYLSAVSTVTGVPLEQLEPLLRRETLLVLDEVQP